MDRKSLIYRGGGDDAPRISSADANATERRRELMIAGNKREYLSQVCQPVVVGRSKSFSRSLRIGYFGCDDKVLGNSIHITKVVEEFPVQFCLRNKCAHKTYLHLISYQVR